MNIYKTPEPNGSVIIRFTNDEVNAMLDRINSKKPNPRVSTVQQDIDERWYASMMNNYDTAVKACKSMNFFQAREWLKQHNMLSPMYAVRPSAYVRKHMVQNEMYMELRRYQDAVCACNTVLYHKCLNEHEKRPMTTPVWNPRTKTHRYLTKPYIRLW